MQTTIGDGAEVNISAGLPETDGATVGFQEDLLAGQVRCGQSLVHAVGVVAALNSGEFRLQLAIGRRVRKYERHCEFPSGKWLRTAAGIDVLLHAELHLACELITQGLLIGCHEVCHEQGE